MKLITLLLLITYNVIGNTQTKNNKIQDTNMENHLVGVWTHIQTIYDTDIKELTNQEYVFMIDKSWESRKVINNDTLYYGGFWYIQDGCLHLLTRNFLDKNRNLNTIILEEIFCISHISESMLSLNYNKADVIKTSLFKRVE